MISKEELKKQADELIFYLDDVAGNRLFKKLRREDKELINSGEEAQSYFVALQFLVIPHLSTHETEILLREHLNIGLNIEDIDIAERIKHKLILLDLADRDNCKRALKSALVMSPERIITEVMANENKIIRTVGDWIKDYVSNLQKQRGGSALERAQYFYQQPYVAKLPESEKNILKKLFALYQFLNISSLTPEGFEDDLLMRTEDGRLVTTNKGRIITLYDFNKEQKIANYQTPKAQSRGKSDSQTLQELAAQYPAGSLERRAVEEEIKKISNN